MGTREHRCGKGLAPQLPDQQMPLCAAQEGQGGLAHRPGAVPTSSISPT